MKPDAKVLLCADTDSLMDPALLDLGEENLEGLRWLEACSDAHAARECVSARPGLEEAWVFCADDMDGINLAAGLGQANPAVKVMLVMLEGSGSLVSRCGAAGVTPCVGRHAFAELVRMAKERYGGSEHDVRRIGLSEALPVIEPVEPVSGRHVAGANPYDHASSSEAATVPFPTIAAPRHETPAKEAFVMTVVSGSGGSGKSTVAAVAACLCQARGLKTLLLDADHQFGDMRFLMGAGDGLTSLEVLEHKERMGELAPHDGMPALLSCPANLEESELVSPSIASLIEVLKTSFDVIVVNTGSFWSDRHIDLLECSSKVLFLIDQRPSSVHCCSRAMELCVRCGVPTQQMHFALNFCDRSALLTSLDVSCALKGVHVSELRNGGRDVSELLGAGAVTELIGAKNAFVASLGAVLDEVLPERFGRQSQEEPVRRRGLGRRKASRPRRRVACL